MKLRELLATVLTITPPAEHPALDLEVRGLSTNSLACQPGDVFIGMPGTRVDGGEFWSGAIASGAIAAIISQQAASKALNHPPESPPACLLAAED
ncbi:MAG: Mur ligase domain-containing protein, partial [Leptodesmis sp.]|uniref:Mur ligase domain-containing protein n=1 Tax=Leptodesmis sp. TaxID=3100501 RepID=UPI003D0A017F